MKTHYLSFNAPIGAAPENQCGRFVYTGLHVTGGEDDPNADPKTAFPKTCNVRDLTMAEKALEFMVFDLSSCIAPDTSYVLAPDPDTVPPPPPLPPPPVLQ